jgi:predicted RNA polymerase sigma factor
MDEELIEEWFINYEQAVTSFLVYYTNSLDVEDLVQDTFITAIKKFPQFKEKAHPKTCSLQLQEIHSGEEMEFMIDSNQKKKQEIEILIKNEEGINVYQQMFTQDAEYIDAETGEPIYSYTDKLVFPKTETWTLIIDGEKTKPFKN